MGLALLTERREASEGSAALAHARAIVQASDAEAIAVRARRREDRAAESALRALRRLAQGTCPMPRAATETTAEETADDAACRGVGEARRAAAMLAGSRAVPPAVRALASALATALRGLDRDPDAAYATARRIVAEHGPRLPRLTA